MVVDPELREMGESTWLRMTTCHPRSYDDLSEEAYEALQEFFIENDQDALQLDIGAVRIGKGGVLYVGFDTEWQPKTEGQGNSVLSYQFYLVAPGGELAKIFYPESGAFSARLSFDDMLSQLIYEARRIGLVLDLPSRIVVCAFFMRADLGSLADFNYFKNRLDNIGGALASLKKDVNVQFTQTDPTAESEDDEATEALPFKNGARMFGMAGELFMVPVRFIDMGKHAPMGSKLSDIGEWIGLGKLEIPAPFSIENMREYLEQDRSGFEAYGRRDAEIPVKFCLALERLVFQELLPWEKPDKPDERVLPATVSGLGIKVFRQTFPDEGSFQKTFGIEEVGYIAYDKTHNRPIQRTECVPIVRRAMFEEFVTRTYSGGRNEAFMGGATPARNIYDFDLASAYTTALVDLRRIDYDQPPRMSNKLDDFEGHVLGFAHVRFQYPAGTRFPGLPVQSIERGLYFPLAGESFCGAPEIAVARRQGCQIEILEGVIYPWKDGDERIFEKFVIQIRDKRNAAKKAKQESAQLYYKLLGNALYGKTAQGLKEKRVFETGTEKSIKLPPSPITHAAMAAHTTSFVRATLAEILHAIPDHHLVASVTTDGFLTTASLAELKLDGPMARRYQALCNRINPGSPMLECKHQVRQVICMRTRGQLTAEIIPVIHPDKLIVLAKSGESTSTNEKGIANEEMIERYLNRQPEQKSTRRSFISLREQVTKDPDVVKVTRDVMMNLEFDLKRRMINPRIIQTRGHQVLTFDTLPWNTAREAEFARAVFDGWRRKRCLKTLEDFEHWEDHYQSKRTVDGLKQRGQRTSVQVTQGGSAGILIRMFLRAYLQNAWGLTKTKTYAELAELFTSWGHPVSVNTVRNGNKGTLIENSVPRTEATQALWRQMREIFDGLDEGTFFFDADEA